MRDLIKSILKDEGMTQNGLAKKLGISPQTLRSVLKGDMRLSSLERIMGALGYEIIARKTPKDWRVL